jgi:glycosyltransferase involved in cell wall biosynthesis
VTAGRKLRIAIDGSAIPARMAGAGVYTYQLVRALAELPRDHRLVVFARPGLFNDLAAQGRLDVVHVGLRSRALRLGWEQMVLPFLLQRHRIDVLHSPHHHTPIALAPPRPRRVVTVHDVTFLLLPQRYPPVRRLYMEAVTRASAAVADAIITPSQTVRNDVIRELRVPSDRVVAVPEAAAPRFAPASDGERARVRGKYGLPQRYVLSVGSREPGKNRARLLRAIALLRDQGLDCALAVVGQQAWRFEDETGLVQRLGLAERVRFLGYVPDDDLPALYSAATVFAYPSLYEGFGLPVLEAMACGTPVVTSSVSATAEVAGDAALLIDPRDTQALAGAIGHLLSDEALHADLRARGLERAGQFSWERAARETLLLYELVAANSQPG